MNTYKIQNPTLNKSRVFILQKSELEKRFDPQFYINRVKIKNSVKLSTLVKVKGGKRIPKGKYYSEIKTEYQYLRVSDMQDFGLINWDGLKFIPEDVYYFLERYKVQKGDVIISIAGTVGKTALIEKEIKNTILTENCAILEIRDKSKLLPKYLHILLELSTSRRQIELGFIQTTIPKLGFDKIEQLQLPEIPSIDKQLEIIAFYDKSITQKQKNEAEADKLLSSIDDYLLKELGIKLPEPPENKLKNRMFTTTISELSGSRFDPRYFQKHYLKFYENLDKLYPTKKIKDLSGYIGSGSTPRAGSDAYTDDETAGVPFIRITNLKNDTVLLDDVLFIKREIHENSLKRTQLKAGDILLSMAGTIGLTVIVPDFIIEANINQALARIVLKSGVSKVYIKEILNSKIGKTQTDRLSRPSVQANLNFDEIGALLIPVPPLDKQKEIAEHITGIRQQAQQIKDQTKELLKKANEEIEQILLN